MSFPHASVMDPNLGAELVPEGRVIDRLFDRAEDRDILTGVHLGPVPKIRQSVPCHTSTTMSAWPKAKVNPALPFERCAQAELSHGFADCPLPVTPGCHD